MAASPSGSFVVVWQGYGEDGSGHGVFGQRYTGAGLAQGQEFRANTHTTDYQILPAVAVDASGNFVVAWSSYGQDDPNWGVFGQRYASWGFPLGPEFQVNSYTPDSQIAPSVATAGSGGYVVVWESYGQDGSGAGIFGQRYASSGAPLGPEFRVNSYTPSHQTWASVAADASGNFVVVWQSGPLEDGFSVGVFGQRYASSGAPVGPEFQVNADTTGYDDHPAVASDPSGNFVVVWNRTAGVAYIYGQRYASSGAPLGPEFRVSDSTTLPAQAFPSVAADASGSFVVVWDSGFGQDGSGTGVFGRRFDSSGVALGAEFQVNTYTTGDQKMPSVAADAAGGFVVVWESYGQDGSDAGIFGQRFSGITPVELLRFSVE